jgi:methylase of polypeptide subunit release factors
MQLPSSEAARHTAQQFRSIGFTVDGVQQRLGAVASSALARDELVPARRELRHDTSPLSVAISLFLLADAVEAEDAEALLGPLGETGELLEVAGSLARSRVEIAPHQADDLAWWIAADWPTGRLHAQLPREHVLGVGGASVMLAQSAVRHSVGSALDIGTGCGIQAFHLAQDSQHVVGTDISERCLEFARYNSILNDIDVELRQGNMLNPVKGERFDSVVSNPPFVIAAPESARHTYRDSGQRGDGLCGELVARMHDHLNDGRYAQLLANWEITDPTDWSRHPRQWLADSPLDAWVLQREVQDPAAYVSTWLTDAGDAYGGEYATRYDQWLTALENRGVVGIGFGLINLRANGSVTPLRVMQHADQPLRQPIGGDIGRWFAAQDLIDRHRGDELLELPLQSAPDVRISRDRSFDDPSDVAITVRRERGLAWSAPIDEFGADLLETADGSQPFGAVVATVAARHNVELSAVLENVRPLVARLVVEGFLWLPGNESE